MPGPRKTPTATLKLRGSWRAKERNGEPEPESGPPEAPPNLPDDERQVWEKFCEITDGMGVLTTADGFPLERYVSMLVRWRKATDWLRTKGEAYPIYQTDKSGELVLDREGRKVLRYMQQWPQVSVAKSLNAALLRIEQEFGLTPSARAGIVSGKGKDDKDSINKFLA